MFPIRMTHESHGAMYAYDTQELEKLKALGWQVEQATAPAITEPRKPGRPRLKAA